MNFFSLNSLDYASVLAFVSLRKIYSVLLCLMKFILCAIVTNDVLLCFRDEVIEVGSTFVAL